MLSSKHELCEKALESDTSEPLPERNFSELQCLGLGLDASQLLRRALRYALRTLSHLQRQNRFGWLFAQKGGEGGNQNPVALRPARVGHLGQQASADCR